MTPLALEKGLQVLGQILKDENTTADLVVIGAGALMLLGELERPTADLDAVAKVLDGELQAAQPFPDHLVSAIRRVGAALDLPHRPRDEKDWLNPGPSALWRLGLPEGFDARLTVRRFDNLTIRLASRVDIIALKFFAATDPQRATRKAVDIADLKRLAPTPNELRHAVRWCARVDGRSDFEQLEAKRLLEALGILDVDHD